MKGAPKPSSMSTQQSTGVNNSYRATDEHHTLWEIDAIKAASALRDDFRLLGRQAAEVDTLVRENLSEGRQLLASIIGHLASGGKLGSQSVTLGA